MRLPSLSELEHAAEVVHRVLPPTLQYRWPLLCQRLGAEVWVKHENHLPLGAFKIRGGLVYVQELLAREPGIKGLLGATRGNHGQSIGFAARHHGLRAVIVVPQGNSREKNAAMRSLGVELIEHGVDFSESAAYARELARREALHFVPSFHDALMRGVATYALELFRAAPDLERVYVPIGMGSGICGVIAAREALGLRTEIVGVVAEGAPAYALSMAAGQPVASERAATMADGMAVRIPDATAFAIIKAHAARVIAVSDDAIQSAMRALFTDTHNVAEGAGAAALAALIQEAPHRKDCRMAVILSGGNIDRDLFAQVLGAQMAASDAA